MSMLELRQVSKVYGQGAAEVHALREVSLDVAPGTMVAVMGPSGSGKSTLLTIAGSLEEPTSGQVLVAGQDLAAMSRNDKARLRRQSIGYVFQDFNLLPGLTAAENVALPLELDGIGARKAREAGLRALDGLGLADRASNYPDQLSGGERQRVAIARAVVGDRHLLLADEPSGALDSANAEAVMRMIRTACKRGVAAVVVTHDAQLASWADRVVFIRDGRIVGPDGARAGPGVAAGAGPVIAALLVLGLLAVATAIWGGQRRHHGPDRAGARPRDAGAWLVSAALPGTRPRGGGVPARRAVMRWGWRLFRREWRQQLLVLGLLTVAVAATIWGASVVTNTQLPNPDYATLGTAAASVTLPGTDPHLAADIAAIQDHWGPADVIETQDIATGTTQPVQLRAESPHGHYTAPLLSLVNGTYPAGPGQVALTSQVAALYDARIGGAWQAAGTTWRVTGIVQNPSNLADEFALAAPGQVTHPSQVVMLVGPAAEQQALGNGGTLPGVPAANVSFPTGSAGGISPATVALVVEVLGLVFIGLVSVAGFSVMAQRRLRALGMLSAIGANERNLRLVIITGGLAAGVAGTLAGAALGLAAWFAYVPTLQQAAGHVVDAANLPWWAFAIGVVLAIATPVLASLRPAATIARVPVVTALSGRPAPPKAVHRSAVPGVIVFAAGVACLAASGGLAGAGGQGHPALYLVAGLAGVVIGIVLLAPLAISMLRVSSRLPVAIRIALRDLVRYRARSGAALAAVTFAVFLAAGICVVASVQFEDVLNWTGPNLSSSQLIVYANPPAERPPC